jgi:hypothetical protein
MENNSLEQIIIFVVKNLFLGSCPMGILPRGDHTKTL